MAPIDTDRFSKALREKSIEKHARRLLISKFTGSDQEKDLTDPPNCRGLGRVRHFRRHSSSSGWPKNPLPIDPAARALGMKPEDSIRAQAFQNAACNWRCWYCFVPFKMLAANPEWGEWVTPGELVDLYLCEPERPIIIDLTGGQPDLVPEWVPWMMEELERRGVATSTYLWSDDNLSNDYFWRELTPAEIDLVRGYRNYGRVCCFKGYDSESFAFNTGAAPALFDRQFELFRRLLQLGIDLYAYVTFTTPSTIGITDRMARFVDRLQEISTLLPLRTVPLEIQMFTPLLTENRVGPINKHAMVNQRDVVAAWSAELDARFPSTLRETPIWAVRLDRR